MSQSTMSSLYARPELFRRDQEVYLRNPEEEGDLESKGALTLLRERIGSGPFRALRILDTPSSKAAPQCITLAEPGSDTPLRTDDGPLQICGYFLSSTPQ